jgi:cytochrome c-type biogenesis protein CcmH
MNDEIDTLRRELTQLKERHDSGALDAAGYEAARAPLERRLVDAVTAGAPAPAAAPASAAAPLAPRPSRRLTGVLSACVLAVACAGYWWTGSPGLIKRVPAAAAPAAGDTAAADGQGAAPTPEQVSAMVDKLAQRLKERPDDAQGWSMLARAYAVLGRTAEALPAFEKAVSLRGNDAGLLADYADTLAVQSDRNLNGAPLKLIERALQAEPGNLKALALAGTAAFDRKDFAAAVQYWEQLKQGVPAESAYRSQVQAGIDEARQLGKLPPSADAVANAAARPAVPNASGAAAAAAGASVSGRVSLAAALAAQAGPSDTVFVFARAAEGPRMPLAVLRKQVKDLPFDFRLDDSMAMSPAATISSAGRVVVGVRVSKSGDAMAQNGDLTGQSEPVAPGASGLKIEIAEVVKK